MTDQDTSDTSQVEPLLGQIDNEIDQFNADGAYDGDPIYDAVLRHGPDAKIVIPPRSTNMTRQDTEPSDQRGHHIASIKSAGRLKWQASTGDGKRALVENAMGRYNGIIGPRLRARSFHTQQTEVAIAVSIVNRMIGAARPKSVR